MISGWTAAPSGTATATTSPIWISPALYAQTGHKVDGSREPSIPQLVLGEEHVEIWSADMTVAELTRPDISGHRGWVWGRDEGGPGARDVGSLTDRTITYNGIDYGLDVIHTASDGSPLSLNFYVDNDVSCSAAVVPPATAKQDLSLVVNNGQWFPFSDATRHCGGLWRWTWHASPAVEWEAGDRVRLSLVAERAALQSLAVTSTPAAGGVYREGETIDVDARFTLGVNVDVAQGRPALMLDVGAAAREAVYAGRSADDTLRFTYTVGPHDAAPDGLGIGARALSLNGGAITTSNNGLDAQIGNQALPPQAGHRVDSATGAASEVALTGIAILSDPGADGLYSLGETITLRLSYSGALRFPEGATPALVLDIGGVERRAAFQGLNGLAALTFAYPTAFGDHDADGLSVVENGLTLPPLAKLRDDFGRTVAHAHAGAGVSGAPGAERADRRGGDRVGAAQPGQLPAARDDRGGADVPPGSDAARYRGGCRRHALDRRRGGRCDPAGPLRARLGHLGAHLRLRGDGGRRRRRRGECARERLGPRRSHDHRWPRRRHAARASGRRPAARPPGRTAGRRRSGGRIGAG